MHKNDWIWELLREYREECFKIRDVLYQRKRDISVERLEPLNKKLEATIEKKLKEARVEELEWCRPRVDWSVAEDKEHRKVQHWVRLA